MPWEINQPATSSWTENATGSIIGVTSYAVGTSQIQGYKINDGKSIYFGTNSDFSIYYSNASDSLKFDYTNPVTAVATNVLTLDNTGVLSFSNVTMDDLVLTKSTSDSVGVPDTTAADGKVVYTEDSSGIGYLYFGVGE